MHDLFINVVVHCIDICRAYVGPVGQRFVYIKAKIGVFFRAFPRMFEEYHLIAYAEYPGGVAGGGGPHPPEECLRPPPN